MRKPTFIREDTNENQESQEGLANPDATEFLNMQMKLGVTSSFNNKRRDTLSK